MIRNSVEYLEFFLTERDSKDISADTVQVTLVAKKSDIDNNPTWLPCTFLAATTDPKTGKPATKWRTTAAITWSVVNYPDSPFAYAKVTDSPEAPWVYLGRVNVTA